MRNIIIILSITLITGCDFKWTFKTHTEESWQEVIPNNRTNSEYEIDMSLINLLARRECKIYKLEDKCNARKYKYMCELKRNEIGLDGKIKDQTK